MTERFTGKRVKIVNRIRSKLSKQTKASSLRSIIFFSFFYLYFWRYIQLQFMSGAVSNSLHFPVFFKGWSFFNSFITSPGGLTEYIAAFLARLFHFSSAGAAVVTLIALLLCFSTDFIVKAFNAAALRHLRFAPAILLLIVYSQYSHHIGITVALMVAVLFACLHIRITKQSSFFYVILLIESTAVYYLAGGAFLVFISICALYEIFVTKKMQTAIVCLLTAIAIPYIIVTIVLGLPTDQAFTCLTPFHWETFVLDSKATAYAVYTMFLILPVTVLLAGLWNLSSNQTLKRSLFDQKISPLKWLLQTLPLIILTATAIFFFTDKSRMATFELNYYLTRQTWPQLLEAAKKNPGSIVAISYADLAMSKTGRLGYDLLKWHKTPNSLVAMFLNEQKYSTGYWSRANICLNVGFINRAQHYTIISLEQCGKLPAILQRLALLHMVKGDNPTAEIYLNALKKTLFHGNFADYYLDAIKNDPSLSQLEEIRNYRKMLNDDRIVIFSKEGPQKALQEQIDKNQNRSAFEYMMGMYLITKRPDGIVKNIPLLKTFGYKRIPRLYEEAIIIYELVTKKKVDLQGYKISDETLANYRKFNDINLRYASNQQAMVAEYEKSLGDSYLPYHYKKARR